MLLLILDPWFNLIRIIVVLFPTCLLMHLNKMMLLKEKIIIYLIGKTLMIHMHVHNVALTACLDD